MEMKKLNFKPGRMMLFVIILFSITEITNSCKKTEEGPGPNEVFIEDMAFNPGTITVKVNTTITWTNKDGIGHTVTSDTGLFDSGTIDTNGTYSHTFTSTGTFPYHCTPHPSMVATVIVN